MARRNNGGRARPPGQLLREAAASMAQPVATQAPSIQQQPGCQAPHQSQPTLPTSSLPPLWGHGASQVYHPVNWHQYAQFTMGHGAYVMPDGSSLWTGGVPIPCFVQPILHTQYRFEYVDRQVDANSTVRELHAIPFSAPWWLQPGFGHATADSTTAAAALGEMAAGEEDARPTECQDDWYNHPVASISDSSDQEYSDNALNPDAQYNGVNTSSDHSLDAAFTETDTDLEDSESEDFIDAYFTQAECADADHDNPDDRDPYWTYSPYTNPEHADPGHDDTEYANEIYTDVDDGSIEPALFNCELCGQQHDPLLLCDAFNEPLYLSVLGRQPTDSEHQMVNPHLVQMDAVSGDEE